MKTLQRFCAAAVLTITLTLSIFAGQIPTPGATEPIPQQSSVTSDMRGPDAAATGDIQAPGVAAFNPVTEAALSLLQGLLSLF